MLNPKPKTLLVLGLCAAVPAGPMAFATADTAGQRGGQGGSRGWVHVPNGAACSAQPRSSFNAAESQSQGQSALL